MRFILGSATWLLLIDAAGWKVNMMYKLACAYPSKGIVHLVEKVLFVVVLLVLLLQFGTLGGRVWEWDLW